MDQEKIASMYAELRRESMVSAVFTTVRIFKNNQWNICDRFVMCDFDVDCIKMLEK